jgi:uncharacterized protein YbjT (DUF2867 family)
MEKRTALLVGATGLVGGHCLRYLLKDETYSRIVTLTRRNLEIENPKLTQHIIDFDQLDKNSDQIKADDIFCCLGTTIKKAGSQEAFRRVDYHYPVKIAQLAAKNGIRQFLLISSLGADKNSKIFYNRVKGETEAAIREIPFYGVQFFRPSLLVGDRTETRGGEKIAEFFLKILKPILIGGWKKYRAISAANVAKAMVEIAKTDLKSMHIYESNQIQFFCDQLQRKGV